MTVQYIPLLAAVSAAIITGYFSFVSLVNSKEQKTSEFRQNWIDSLRNDISEFVSSVYFIESYHQQQANTTDPDFIKGLKEVKVKYASAGTAILLRVNENEKNKYLKIINDDFLSSLVDVMDAVNKGQYTEGTKRCNILIDKSKPLLKEEWKRVKAGELAYKVIKYFSIILFAVALITALLISCNMQNKSNENSRNITRESEQTPESAHNSNSLNCTVNVSSEPFKPGKSRTVIKTDKSTNSSKDLPKSDSTTKDCQ